MATASVKTSISAVTLKLSPREAQALVHVLAEVGGDPNGSRGQIQHIHDVLRQVGFLWDKDLEDHCALVEGHVRFRD